MDHCTPCTSSMTDVTLPSSSEDSNGLMSFAQTSTSSLHDFRAGAREEGASSTGAETSPSKGADWYQPPPAPCCPPAGRSRWARLPRDDVPPRRQLACAPGHDARPPAPPLWRTTARRSPAFAGWVPYLAADQLDPWEVPLTATADGDFVCVYVGLYADLRERLAVLQATVDFETDSVVRRHRRHGGLVREAEARGAAALQRMRAVAGDVRQQRQAFAELNRAARRRGLQPP